MGPRAVAADVNVRGVVQNSKPIVWRNPGMLSESPGTEQVEHLRFHVQGCQNSGRFVESLGKNCP